MDQWLHMASKWEALSLIPFIHPHADHSVGNSLFGILGVCHDSL